jgi:hypothetical protein
MVGADFTQKGSNMVGSIHKSNLSGVYRTLTEDLETQLFFNKPVDQTGTRCGIGSVRARLLG